MQINYINRYGYGWPAVMCFVSFSVNSTALTDVLYFEIDKKHIKGTDFGMLNKLCT